MSAPEDAIEWAKNNPGPEAVAHLLLVIDELQAWKAHRQETDFGHAKGLRKMRRLLNQAKAENRALQKVTLDINLPRDPWTVPIPIGDLVPPGRGRHRKPDPFDDFDEVLLLDGFDADGGVYLPGEEPS